MSNVIEIQQLSPALKGKSGHYPASWYGKVPKRVKMAKTVVSDYPFDASRVRAINGTEYEVWVNAHGAVSAILSDGKLLGLKPYEFEIIEWHPAAPPATGNTCETTEISVARKQESESSNIKGE